MVVTRADCELTCSGGDVQLLARIKHLKTTELQKQQGYDVEMSELKLRLAFTAQVSHNKRSCCVMWVFVVFRLGQRG